MPAPRQVVFDFFSSPENLEQLTPDWLGFRIVAPTPIEVRVGARNDYRLTIHGIPIRWRSEISHWDPPCSFVDEQRRGPYQTWIHCHSFAEERGGTLIGDKVEYRPLGGRLINQLFVRRDVERIFRYRGEVLQRHFASAD